MYPNSRLLCAALLAILLAACAAPNPTATTAPAADAAPQQAAAAPGRLIYSDDGLTEIQAPPAWQVRPNLSRSADLRLSNESQDHYLLVNTYLHADTNNLPFDELSRRINGALLGNIAQGKMSEARKITLGGLPAIEHELRGKVDDLELVYYSVMVDGKRGRYHIVGWAPLGSDTAGLKDLIGGFRESAAPRQARQRVSLKFNWPDRAKAKVTFKHQTSWLRGSYDLQGEYDMAVRPAGTGELLVSMRMRRQTMNNTGAADDARKDAFLQNLIKQASSNLPDYVVNRDGEFVRIENLGAYHQRVRDAIVKGLPVANLEAQTRVQEMVDQLFTAQTLAVAMQDDWNGSVEQWAGGSYAVGENYQFVQPYQTSVTGEQVFPMVTTQRLAARVPCRPNAAKNSCVRLVQTSRVDGPEYREAMNAYVSKTVGHGVRVTHVEVLKSVEVIADPATLLPYFTHKKDIKRVTVEADGKQQSTEDVENTEVSYRY